MDVIYTSKTREGGGGLKAELKVWEHSEPGRTSAKKVTDKGALSKHSCRTCVHICVFVYTHTGCLLPASPRGFMAFRGWSLNKSPAPSRSLESQHLSAHIIFQIPEPSLKTKTHSAFFLLRCCFHPSIHPPVSLFLTLSVPRLDGIPVVCACYSTQGSVENTLEPDWRLNIFVRSLWQRYQVSHDHFNVKRSANSAGLLCLTERFWRHCKNSVGAKSRKYKCDSC